MSSGHSKVRRRFKRPPALMSISWRLTADQAEFFLGWVEYLLDGAVNPFLMNMRSPGGVVPHEFRFITHPAESVKPKGSKWLYTAKVEVKELPVMSEENFAAEIFKPSSVEQVIESTVAVINDFPE